MQMLGGIGNLCTAAIPEGDENNSLVDPYLGCSSEASF